MAAELKVGVCAIMKNEADYVEEWLAFHVLQGVSHAVLYDNNSTDDTVKRALSLAPRIAVKTVARPERIIRFDSVHSVELASGAYLLSDAQPLPPRPDHLGCSSIVPAGALRLHHDMLESREQFERKKSRWAGQDLSGRYNDEYFESRERIGNAVRDERLRSFAARIEEMIGRSGSALR
jgi:hypothetical protein